MDPSAPEMTSRHLLYSLVGAALLGATGVLVIASGLVAPGWVVALLALLWMAAVAVSLVTWRQRAWAPLVAGLTVFLVWSAVILVGRSVTGWQT